MLRSIHHQIGYRIYTILQKRAEKNQCCKYKFFGYITNLYLPEYLNELLALIIEVNL